MTTDAPGVHKYFFGVGGSGRRPVSPPTPRGPRASGVGVRGLNPVFVDYESEKIGFLRLVYEDRGGGLRCSKGYNGRRGAPRFSRSSVL